MAGTMTVHPEEIRKCAKTISQMTETSSKLNNMATQNSVPQLSWGALGNLLGLYEEYDGLLGQLHDHFTKMSGGFEKIGDALQDTAQTYHENEQVTKQRFNDVMNQMIDGAQAPPIKGGHAESQFGVGSSYTGQYSADNAVKSAEIPIAGPAYSAVQDARKTGSDAELRGGVGIAADSANIVGDAASYVTSAADIAGAVADPLNWLISKGLGFLLDVVTPLKQLVDLVTGDPDATSKAADGFQKIYNGTKQLANQYDGSLRQGLRSWSGDAAESAAKRLSEFKDGIDDTGSTAAHVASVLQASSMLMKVAEEVLKGILSDLVEWLIITWLAALATSVVTAGASDAAAAAATPAEVAAEVARGGEEVNKVRSLLTKIVDFLKKIKKFLDSGATKVFKKMNESTAGKNVLKKFTEGDAGRQFAEVGEKGWKGALKERLNDSIDDNVQNAVGVPHGKDANQKIQSWGDSVNTWTGEIGSGGKLIQDQVQSSGDDEANTDRELDV